MDNFKVIYKILSVLEKSMDLEQCNPESISAETLRISQERWNKKDNKKNGRICLSFIISNCRNSVTKQKFRHLSCQEKQRNLVII